MGKYGLVGEGVRKRISLNGQNFYLIVTKTSVDCTVPYENRSGQRELRETVDRLCSEISELMQVNGGVLK